MDIITAHEADQIIRLKQPLAWPPHNSCNGNCQQGRACDCTSNVDTADADDWEPLTLRDHLMFWVPVGSITVGLVAFVLFAAGVRV